jgi:hypothetical protein
MSSEKGKSQVMERPVTEEAIFKMTKEIVVKFIEVGRLTPANFPETYDMVYRTVRKAAEKE